MPRPRLTARQRAILDFIEAGIADAGIPPTLRELTTAFSVGRSAILGHIAALESKGCLKREPGATRGIQVLSPTEPDVKQLRAALELIVTRDDINAATNIARAALAGTLFE